MSIGHAAARSEGAARRVSRGSSGLSDPVPLQVRGDRAISADVTHRSRRWEAVAAIYQTSYYYLHAVRAAGSSRVAAARVPSSLMNY